jgi:hypothetical protein
VTPEELAALRRELTEQTVSTLVGLFYGLDEYRDADAVAFVEAALPILRAGQVTMADLVAQFLASVAAEAVEAPPGAEPTIVIPVDLVTDLRQDDGLDVVEIPVRGRAGATVTVDTVSRPRGPIRGGLGGTAAPRPPGGVTRGGLGRMGGDPDAADRMRQVYRRPFATLYTELSRDPTDMTGAVEAAGNRLADIVEMDLQQTYAVAAREGMERMPDKPAYWRRVPTGPSNCALCILAATRKYRRADLDPIHPGCDCTVVPIMSEALDPIDEDALYDRAHAAAREATGSDDVSGRAVDYRKIATTITASHGEHPAPLLVNPTDHFTDLSEVVETVTESETDSADRP